MLFVSRLCLILLLIFGAYLFGRFAHLHNWPTERLLRSAQSGAELIKDQLTGALPEYALAAPPGPKVAGAASPGLVLVSSITPDGGLNVQAVRSDGTTAHRWDLGWFRIWPDATHVPKALKPKSAPGTEIEGLVLSPNGDLTFNYENLGMVQVDVCGAVKWRLPRLTHHSLIRDEAGDLWAPSMIYHQTAVARLPNHTPPFLEATVIKVSPEGKVLREISVPDLLLANGLPGLLYLSTRDNWSTRVDGDTHHLNDIDVFPSTLKPGVAAPGDLMISLRNANTILIVDQATLRIKHMVRDRFVRQHDPDFVDGDHITVFDNNNVSDVPGAVQSRLIEIDLRTDAVKTLFAGSAKAPFYTRYMGRAQVLPDGNRLLAEAAQGRVIEVAPDGRIVWQYRNLIAPGVAGRVYDAQHTDIDLAALGKGCPKA